MLADHYRPRARLRGAMKMSFARCYKSRFCLHEREFLFQTLAESCLRASVHIEYRFVCQTNIMHRPTSRSLVEGDFFHHPAVIVSTAGYHGTVIASRTCTKSPRRLIRLHHDTAATSPLVVSGIGTGPPGESGSRAVRTSTPSSVTSRVCSST